MEKPVDNLPIPCVKTVKETAGLCHVLLSAGAHVNHPGTRAGPRPKFANLQKLLVLEGLFCQYEKSFDLRPRCLKAPSAYLSTGPAIGGMFCRSHAVENLNRVAKTGAIKKRR